MDFFDCNTFVGSPAGKTEAKSVSAEQLLAEMDRAGIQQALVWHAAQRDHDPLVGNELLAGAIKGRDRLVGCFSPLPPQTEEVGDVGEWLERAAGAGVLALRAFPKSHNYLLRWEVLGELF